MNQALKTSLNGVFSIYKPKGITSRDAASLIQLYLTAHVYETTTPWKVKQKSRVKIGIGGILDPIAEGVLVLGLGTGCKQLESYLKGNKAYIATGQIGIGTDTYDSEGKVIQEKSTQHITKELLLSTLNSFQGPILQKPPLYSGVRMNGKRLYEYARQGKELPKQIEAKTVNIYKLDLLRFQPNNMIFELSVQCGGGTYIRSLIHDIGVQMETCAHMTRLIRTQQGLWTTDTSLPFLDINNKNNNNNTFNRNDNYKLDIDTLQNKKYFHDILNSLK